MPLPILLVFWLGLNAFLLWLCYAILFKDARDRTLASQSTSPSPVYPWVRIWSTRLVRLLNISALIILLGFPLVGLLILMPAVFQAHQLGLDAAEIHLASHLEQHQQDFADLPPLLVLLANAPEDFNAQAWKDVRAYLQGQLGALPRLGRDPWQLLVDWGRQILQRRGAGGPRTAEPVAVRTALNHLVGQDDLPGRMQQFRQKVGDRRAQAYLGVAFLLHAYYPNDDLAYLLFSNGRIIQRGPLGPILLLLLPTLALLPAVLALVIQRGFKILTVRLAGSWLGLGGLPRFRWFEQEAFNPWRYLACVAVVFLGSALVAPRFADPYHALLHQTPFLYLLAIWWNVLIGGVLVESLGNLVTLLYLRGGRNPFRSVSDNLLVLLVSFLVLGFFHNSPVSIVASLLLGLTLSLVQKWLAYRAGFA